MIGFPTLMLLTRSPVKNGQLQVDRDRSGKRKPLRTYSLYGIRLKSEQALPCPQSRQAAPAEVELFEAPAALFGEAAREALRQPNGSRWFRRAHLRDGSTYLWWSELFEFLISADGRRIATRPLAHASREALHTYLLGQVLSFALVKQGIEPLHATVVAVEGEAVGFLGDCGYGKSSLGAAFLAAGHSLLTDDLLVLREEDRGFLAYPGLPRVKLFPEVARSLFGKRVQGTPLNNLISKLIIPLDRRQSCRSATPLKALYVLTSAAGGARSQKVIIRRLSRRRAFLPLLRNTFNAAIVQPERLKRQFLLAGRLVSKVPIKSLSYPKDLSLLPSVREAILADLKR